MIVLSFDLVCLCSWAKSTLAIINADNNFTRSSDLSSKKLWALQREVRIVCITEVPSRNLA